MFENQGTSPTSRNLRLSPTLQYVDTVQFTRHYMRILYADTVHTRTLYGNPVRGYCAGTLYVDTVRGHCTWTLHTHTVDGHCRCMGAVYGQGTGTLYVDTVYGQYVRALYVTLHNDTVRRDCICKDGHGTQRLYM
jgi:hypothetical protein